VLPTYSTQRHFSAKPNNNNDAVNNASSQVDEVKLAKQ